MRLRGIQKRLHDDKFDYKKVGLIMDILTKDLVTNLYLNVLQELASKLNSDLYIYLVQFMRSHFW